jgi:hypothetical protein
MKVDEMPASREMDILVKEKVLGSPWDPNYCRICGFPLRSDTLLVIPSHDLCSEDWFLEYRADTPAPYSSVESEALGVLHAKGWLYSLHNYRSLGVTVVIYSSHPESQDVRARGETLPEAVCRAALKRVGLE